MFWHYNEGDFSCIVFGLNDEITTKYICLEQTTKQTYDNKTYDQTSHILE